MFCIQGVQMNNVSLMKLRGCKMGQIRPQGNMLSAERPVYSLLNRKSPTPDIFRIYLKRM